MLVLLLIFPNYYYSDASNFLKVFLDQVNEVEREDVMDRLLESIQKQNCTAFFLFFHQHNQEIWHIHLAIKGLILNVPKSHNVSFEKIGFKVFKNPGK